MGALASTLRQLSATLSWLSAQLPKQPQLYSDRFADPHEVDPLVSPNWQQERDYSLASPPSTTCSRSGDPGSGGNWGMSYGCAHAWRERATCDLATSHLAAFGCCVGYQRRTLRGNCWISENVRPVFVIDPEAVGHQFDPLHGRVTERQLYAAAKYLLYEAGERDPIFIQRGIKMVTQLFLAARGETAWQGMKSTISCPMPGSS